MTKALVVGGGIAGLTAAFRAPHRDVVVLEGSDRLGGCVRTIREDGLVLEGGPNTLLTSEAADRLLADLGLDGDLIVADGRAPRYLVRGGRPRSVVPGPPGLFTGAISFGGKLRLLGEPFVAKRPDGLEDESVASFFARRFGAEAARQLAGPIVSGVYADDPATLSVRSAFAKLWDAEGVAGSVVKGLMKAGKERKKAGTPRHRGRTVSFRNGLATLIETLGKRLTAEGARIETNAGAERIESAAGGAWRVVTHDGRAFEADKLLLTVDAPRLVSLLGDRLPRSRARLAALAYSKVSVALMAFEVANALDAPVGFGTLIPRGEGFRALGILYLSSLFPGRNPAGLALLTAFLGGALEPDLPGRPDDELLALAESEARRMHPRLGKRTYGRVVKWEAAIPRLPLGHHETLRLLDEDLAALPPSLVVTGPWRDGVSLSDRITRAEALGPRL